MLVIRQPWRFHELVDQEGPARPRLRGGCTGGGGVEEEQVGVLLVGDRGQESLLLRRVVQVKVPREVLLLTGHTGSFVAILLLLLVLVVVTGAAAALLDPVRALPRCCPRGGGGFGPGTANR